MRWRTYSIEEACISGKRLILIVFHEHSREEYFSLDITIDEVKAWGFSPADVVKNSHLYVLEEELQIPPIEINKEELREPIRRIKKSRFNEL